MRDAADPAGLPFVKMHGAGNHFVIVDSRRRQAVATPALARALADPRRGVGFDQLAEITDGDDLSGGADIALAFWNADGGRAGACGNATRCVADRVMAETGRTRLAVATERGVLAAERRLDGQVAVNMGAPLLDWRDVPLARDVPLDPLPLSGAPAALGMGNPHCVFVVEDAEVAAVETLGPAVAVDPLFPEGANVEFVSLAGPDRLRMRVWERGSGLTLACGSGACAAAVVACRRGLTGPSVEIEADGGTLQVAWRGDGVWLSGPVAEVFRGRLTAAFMAGVR